MLEQDHRKRIDWKDLIRHRLFYTEEEFLLQEYVISRDIVSIGLI